MAALRCSGPLPNCSGDWYPLDFLNPTLLNSESQDSTKPKFISQLGIWRFRIQRKGLELGKLEFGRMD